MAKIIGIFGGSFNPPGKHHSRLLLELMNSGYFEKIVFALCGPRPEDDKGTVNDTPNVHRAAMADLEFGNIEGVRVDLDDLERETFTRTWELDQRYRAEFGRDVWHIIGSDLIQGGCLGRSPIQRTWERGAEVWEQLKFYINERPGYPIQTADLPPNYQVFDYPPIEGSSTEIRDAIFHHQPFERLVSPRIASYIKRYGLYRGATSHATRFDLEEGPRLLIMADERNPKALEVARGLERLACPENPNLVVAIGGDGTMSRALRSEWRRRLPFFGIGAGHECHLLNLVDCEFTPDFFRQTFHLWLSRLLYVETADEQGHEKTAFAVNDAWVQAEPGGLGWIRVVVNNEVKIPRLEADGALVATALGSTGYARSMGAQPLLPETPQLLVVGSNARKPFGWKSMPFAIDSRVEFSTADPTPPPKKRPLLGFADGKDGTPFGQVTNMRVRSSNTAAVQLLFLPEADLQKKQENLILG